MGKKKASGGAAIKVTGQRKARCPARVAMVAKLQRINGGLGQLLTPRYASAGQEYIDLIAAAQAAVVQAGLLVADKPAAWQPSAAKRGMTAERLEKLREKAAELAARIKAAEAVL